MLTGGRGRAVTIQIIGTKGCALTRKAVRFFKERGIPFAFVDLEERALTKGELENIARSVAPAELIDRSGRRYERRGLEHMEFDSFEELLGDPLLFRTPIIRLGPEAVVGDAADSWQRFAVAAKGSRD